MRRVTALVLAASVVCTLTAQDWPSARGNASLSGAREADLRLPLGKAWTFRASDEVSAAAAVAGNRVVFTSLDGVLWCLDRTTGRLLWQRALGTGTEAPPLIDDQKIFVGDGDGGFHCFRLDTGEPVWKVATDGKVAGGATATVLNGKRAVLFGGYDRWLRCLDAATGRQLWGYEAANYINGSPAVDRGRVIFGGCDGALRILSLDSGQPLFTLEAGSYVPASPAIAKRTAFAATYGGRLLAFSTATGRILWSSGAPGEKGSFLGSPAVAGSLVVTGSKDGWVRGWDAESGRQVWQFATGGPVDPSPAVAGTVVLAASSDGWLYALDLKTGRQRWATEVGGRLGASPVVAENMVFLGTPDGRMLAWSVKPGEKESH